MKGKTTKNFILKIVLSYFVLGSLALISGLFIFSEINRYITTSATTEVENKLFETNFFLTNLYEAERLSKLALQKKTKAQFNIYTLKIVSIGVTIDSLKLLTESLYQKKLLDSVAFLLKQKIRNYDELIRFKVSHKPNVSIDSAIEKLKKVEVSLGKITPEALAPNLKELPLESQKAIKKLADYINANVPKDTLVDSSKKIDSILQNSKLLLKQIRKKNILNQYNLGAKELEISKNDFELSQRLQSIIASFQQEALLNAQKNNVNEQAILQKSIQLAGITALIGFIIVAFFTFLISKDFWKSQLYRQKLEKKKKLSESLLKSREQLIRMVSHDLQTPLNTINGYSDLIKKTILTKIQKEYFKNIESASSYVENLVNDLLDYSKLEAGKLILNNTNFNPYKLIKETAESIGSLYPNKTIRLNLNLDEKLNKFYLCDSFRIKQILTNLIGNAYKFTNTGSINIIAEFHSKKLKIDIIDTGIGIAKSKQKDIFNEFTQANIETEIKYGGYGLGLTISKKLISLLNGKLNLKSEENKGSTFSIELPLTDSKIEPINNSISSILIIDDDDSLLKMLGEMLRKSGLTVYSFNTFLNIDKNDTTVNYDLVLTDIQMPNISGFELLKKLSSGSYIHFKNQPIMAMTGNRDLPTSHYLSKGFSQVLYKPFSKQDFIDSLYNLGITIPENLNTTPINNLHELYSLEILRSFLDEEGVNSVLQTFIFETNKNLQLLLHAFKDYNCSKLNEEAHKMLPMFRQLKVDEMIILSLEKLEVIKDLQPHEFSNLLLQNLKTNIELLIKALQQKIATNLTYND